MKTRRTKKSKKGKTIRKRILLIGGEKPAVVQIEENAEEIAKAFFFIINEKYDVHDFSSPKCAAAMIKYYQNIVPLKNEWGTGKFKDQDVVLDRLSTTTNHLVDLYPDVAPDKTKGGQSGGIGWDFNKETQFLKIMKYINLHKRKAKNPYYEGWKGFSSKFQRAVADYTRMSWSDYTEELTPRGVYQNSTRELEDIIHYYWCLVSYLSFIISKISAEKRQKLENLNSDLIKHSKQLIDEYGKWNFMLISDDKNTMDISGIVNKNKNEDLFPTQYAIIDKYQKEIIKDVSGIDHSPELKAFKTHNNLGEITAYTLEKISDFSNNCLHTDGTLKINDTAVKRIDKLTKSKKDFAEVFANQIEQSVIEAKGSKNTNEFDAEEKSLQKYISEFKRPDSDQIIVVNNSLTTKYDTIPQIINKLKLEYNTNSEFIIRIMHLLERLGNDTRDGQNKMNHGEFRKNKQYFREHPFSRFAKTYISGIRTLIETLIDIHTAFKENNPTAENLRIRDLNTDYYIFRKNDHNLVHAALKRFYRMGNDPGTINQSGPRSISNLGTDTNFKDEFTQKFAQIIKEKEIRMRFTNLENILIDLSENVPNNLVFNECSNFLIKDLMDVSGDKVDVIAGMWPKTEYNKLKKIWSDTSASGLVKMEKFLKEKNKFKLDKTSEEEKVIIHATLIKENLDKTEQKIRSIFIKRPEENIKDDDKQYLKNVQNCFFIIDHYSTKIKNIISKGEDLSGQWQLMAKANNGFDKTIDVDNTVLTYLWMNNVSEYFRNNKKSCTLLPKFTPQNIDKVFHYVSAELLNKIIVSCDDNSNIVTHLDIDFLYRLSDDTVKKHLLVYLNNIDKPKRAEVPTISTAISREISASLSLPPPALSDDRKMILYRLLTLASPDHLSTIFDEQTRTEAIIKKMHDVTVSKGGGLLQGIQKSMVGKKNKVFNIRTAYDHIFEEAKKKQLTFIVESLIKLERLVDVIKILGDSNPVFNDSAIGKIKKVVNESSFKKQFENALNEKNNLTARNYYSIDIDSSPDNKKNEIPTEDDVNNKRNIKQINAIETKPVYGVETDFRKDIKDFVGGNLQNEPEIIQLIHEMYDRLAKHKEIKGDRKLLKKVVNNLIDYTASAFLGSYFETNPTALIRRNLLIDQFTRLNTKPNVDPFLERIISTFWPEADAIPYKRPQTEIISKETLIETKLFPTLPTIKMYPNDNDNTEEDKKNKTYGSKIMTLTEKVNGDQSDYDTLGVEMFLNTLMTTGSNVGFVPEVAYSEKYKFDERIDNSAYIYKET